ncbi:MAG TPA: hypothetical protein VFS56_11920, partial [Gemmatimonadaceae bacterium]|nr:hypothetical protein [Gemmatimonadaceae bacterium]
MNRATRLSVRVLLGLNLLSCTPLQRASSPMVFPEIELRNGLVITKSARVASRTYHLPGSSSPDSAVITIRGDGITLDFAGATMEG